MSGGIEVQIDVSDLGRMSKLFRKMSGKATANKSVAAHNMGVFLKTHVQQNASGRPGPNVVTGAYRASIQMTGVEENGNFATVTVFTNAVQAQRLEFGFVGTDAIGRHYAQPPFPHWQPAILELQANRRSFYDDLSEGLT